MQTIRFEYSSIIHAPVEALWEFHMRPEALELLSPRIAGFRIIDPGSGVADDSLVKAEIGFGPFRHRWHALHSGVRTNRGFTDVAVESPFRYWLHQHSMKPVTDTRSRLTDVIWLVPPRGIPAALARPFVSAALRLLFAWRHRQTRRAVEDHSAPSLSTLHSCSQDPCSQS